MSGIIIKNIGVKNVTDKLQKVKEALEYTIGLTSNAWIVTECEKALAELNAYIEKHDRPMIKVGPLSEEDFAKLVQDMQSGEGGVISVDSRYDKFMERLDSQELVEEVSRTVGELIINDKYVLTSAITMDDAYELDKDDYIWIAKAAIKLIKGNS